MKKLQAAVSDMSEAFRNWVSPIGGSRTLSSTSTPTGTGGRAPTDLLFQRVLNNMSNNSLEVSSPEQDPDCPSREGGETTEIVAFSWNIRYLYF